MLLKTPTTGIWKEMADLSSNRSLKQIKDKYNSIRKDNNYQKRFPGIFEAAEVVYQRLTGRIKKITREHLIYR